jgi:hypothetical protein
LKAKDLWKTCVEFVFEKIGSFEYNTWTIVPIACLWLVQSVDTAQAHIYYIYHLPNLYKIKFLENLLAGFRGSGISGVCPESPDFPDIPDLTRRLRVVKV